MRTAATYAVRGRGAGRRRPASAAREADADYEEDRHRDEPDPGQQIGADAGYELGDRAADLVPGIVSEVESTLSLR
jgi:hypothetical protein